MNYNMHCQWTSHNDQNCVNIETNVLAYVSISVHYKPLSYFQQALDTDLDRMEFCDWPVVFV